MHRSVLASGAAALAVSALLALSGILGGAEQRLLDARFAIRGQEPVRGITVVAIDEETFSELDVTWPFRRRLHAQVVDRLRRAGARQIVYDVQFTEPSQRPADDLALFDAVARARGTILATGEIDRGRTRVLGGDGNLARIGAQAAAANFPGEGNGMVRRYERAVQGVPTMAVATARRLGTDPEFPRRRALIDFRGPAGTIPTVSFSDVLAGRVPARELRGQIVVIGASAAVLQDRHPTPMGGRQMSGPEIQANAIWTALNDNPLREVPGWVAVLAFLLCGAAGPSCVGMLRPVRGALAALALGGAYAVGAQLAFEAGAVLPVAEPLLALAAGTLVALATAAAREVALRRQFAWRNRVLESAVRERTAQLEASQLEIVERLARASELRDDETGQHVDRMSQMCERVALELGMEPREAALLRRAAVLHDIGKLGISDAILRKPGLLDEDEIREMRTHTTAAEALLAGSPSPILQLAETIALTHHERWDGSGYPRGLRGEQIPLAGRIAAVCDVYDALVSARPYKKAWTVAAALEEIRAQRGRHFDPAVADALLAVVARDAQPPAIVADVAAPASDPLAEAPARLKTLTD
jgi:CHASE2 domain-containing sensor protein